jgi:hypothetical protein
MLLVVLAPIAMRLKMAYELGGPVRTVNPPTLYKCAEFETCWRTGWFANSKQVAFLRGCIRTKELLAPKKKNKKRLFARPASQHSKAIWVLPVASDILQLHLHLELCVRIHFKLFDFTRLKSSTGEPL